VTNFLESGSNIALRGSASLPTPSNSNNVQRRHSNAVPYLAQSTGHVIDETHLCAQFSLASIKDCVLTFDNSPSIAIKFFDFKYSIPTSFCF
jgi:hypothetical protein